MNIKDKLIEEYPLTKQVEFPLDCFEIDKGKYLIFWNEIIKKENIIEVLNYLEDKSNNSNFTEYKTFIIVGHIKEKFKKSDVVYFNGVNQYVVFYLMNDVTNDIYMNPSWTFPLKFNCRKYIKRINEILNK